MPRLVSITVTALVDDDVDVVGLANVLFDVAEKPVEIWAEVNSWEIELLDIDITRNVEAE